jgi:hypothetical protein
LGVRAAGSKCLGIDLPYKVIDIVNTLKTYTGAAGNSNTKEKRVSQVANLHLVGSPF